MATHLNINGSKISVNKEIDSITGSYIFFVDGSYINTDTGEARDGHGNVWEIPVGITETPIAEIRQEFENAFSFNIQDLSTVDTLIIETHDLPTVSVFITGPKDSVDALMLTRQGETISLKGKPGKSGRGIYIGNITVIGNLNISNVSISNDDNGATTIIKVPVGFELDVKNVDANIKIGNTYGKLTLQHSSSRKVKVGDVLDLSLIHSGSGNIELANITGKLSIVNNSSAHIKAQNVDVKSANVVLSGSGNFSAHSFQVASEMNLTINSNGRVTITALFTSAFTFKSNGSGDTVIDTLHAQVFKAALSSSGYLNITTLVVAETYTSTQQGSGDLKVKTALINGDVSAVLSSNGVLMLGDLKAPTVSLNTSGSGNVEMNNITTQALTTRQTSNGDIKLKSGEIRGPLKVVIQGSGDFNFGGTTESADLFTNSSGGITVQASRHQPKKAKKGSGDIRVKNWQ